MHWIAKASAVVGRLSALWRKPSISCRTKMHIYNTLVGSMLLYGAETWPATRSVLSTVNIAQTKHLCRIEGLRRHNFVSNENLLALTGQTPFSVQLAQQTLRWFEHLLSHAPQHSHTNYFWLWSRAARRETPKRSSPNQMEGLDRCLLSHGIYSGGCPHPCRRPVQMEAPCSITRCRKHFSRSIKSSKSSQVG